MHLLEYFYNKTTKYDFLNKFNYKKIYKIPKIKKIILSFSCETDEIKQIASSLLALELISNQKSTLTKTKSSNINLKLKKGNPVGCKVTLQKKRMFDFIFKTTVNVFPKLKNFNGLKLNKNNKEKLFSYEFKETFNFNELEKQYYIFNNLSKLKITIVTDSTVQKELIFLLKSLQLPILYCKYNSIGRV